MRRQARAVASVAWLCVSAAGLTGCIEAGGAGRGSDPADAGVDVYADPPLSVRQILLAEDELGNPREIRLFIPERSGVYPLLQFQHGFISDVDTYTDLLSRLAGFGFLIAAPQMYVGDPSTAPSVADETSGAVEVLNWNQSALNDVLATQVTDLSVRIAAADTGLFGHSRGGQVAWRMIFDHPGLTARAIAGVDPVDGDAPPFPPGGTGEMVTDDDGAFQFPFPSLILGMSEGGSGVPGFECAPVNRNYTFFYEASLPPRYEVVADGYGHSDMLNGDNPDVVCPGTLNGTRPELRRFVAGQLAGFFTAVLQGGSFATQTNLTDTPVPAFGRFEEL